MWGIALSLMNYNCSTIKSIILQCQSPVEYENVAHLMGGSSSYRSLPNFCETNRKLSRVVPLWSPRRADYYGALQLSTAPLLREITTSSLSMDPPHISPNWTFWGRIYPSSYCSIFKRREPWVWWMHSCYSRLCGITLADSDVTFTASSISKPHDLGDKTWPFKTRPIYFE